MRYSAEENESRKSYGRSWIVPSVLALLAIISTVFFFIAVHRGTLSMLLNPRYFGRTGLGILGITSLSVASAVLTMRHGPGRGHRPGREHRPGRGHGHGETSKIRAIGMLLIPLALVPAVARYTSTDSAGHRLFVSSSTTGSVKQQAIVPTDVPDDEEKTVAPEGGAGLGEEPIQPGDSPIVVTTAEFDAILRLLWDDPEGYVGRRVRIIGFSYFREDWTDELFVVARMLMWCCAADAYIVGLAVEASDAYPRPLEKQWIEVEGILGVTTRIETGATVLESVPTLRDAEWRVVPPPESEYVFPSF